MAVTNMENEGIHQDHVARSMDSAEILEGLK